MNNGENSVLTESIQKEVQSVQKEVRLVDVVVSDENIALNLMVGFLSLGQKRGVFSIDESAKIWDCIKMFQKSHPSA